MRNSKIDWTDHTFNPWIGCTKVSQGCKFCYAETQNQRYHWNPDGWGPGTQRKRTSKANWNKVRQWDRQAQQEGANYRVFCASLADVLDPEVPQEWRLDVFALADSTPRLTWQFLTKRPENYPDMRPPQWAEGCPSNVWWGVTVENQETAGRIRHLNRIPARVRFLSMEPLLEMVNIQGELLDGWHKFAPKIHWVIVGGESGPKARPMDLEWALSLRRQCETAGTSFFMKQLGGHPDKRHKIEQFPVELRVREFPTYLSIWRLKLEPDSVLL